MGLFGGNKSTSNTTITNKNAGISGSNYGDILGGTVLNVAATGDVGNINTTSMFAPVSISYGDKAIESAERSYTATISSAAGVRGSLVSGETLKYVAYMVIAALLLKFFMR